MTKARQKVIESSIFKMMSFSLSEEESSPRKILAAENKV